MATNTEIDKETMQDFFVECHENIDQIERDLVLWEKQPEGREVLQRIFRGFHTLKGTSGFLGFEQLESLAHQAENVLSRIQDENLAVNSSAVTVLLKVVDAVRLILRELEQTGEEGEGDYEVLVTELKLKTLQKQLESQAELQKKQERDEAVVPTAIENSVRIDVQILDRWITLAGELNEEHRRICKVVDREFGSGVFQSIEKIQSLVEELQNSIQQARLTTFENSWGRFSRYVRDMGTASGKKVRMLMTGQDTKIEARFSVVLKDSMTHLLRNCVDHGIQIPAKRMAEGKSEEGTIQLRASGDGKYIIIEIEDDGSGIQPEKIRETAIRCGYITEAELDGMSPGQILYLIFLPGFSTAREVTKLSGRGVGLDIVKTNIEKIGGSVEVMSQPGKGTLFTLKVPSYAAQTTHLSNDIYNGKT